MSETDYVTDNEYYNPKNYQYINKIYHYKNHKQ